MDGQIDEQTQLVKVLYTSDLLIIMYNVQVDNISVVVCTCMDSITN